MKNSPTIEHLDLEIDFRPECLTTLKTWLTDFTDDYPYVTVQPKLRESYLMINSQDFVEFLAYVHPNEWDELTWARFRKTAEKQLEILLQKSVHPELRYHYQWCLAALGNLKDGRKRLVAEILENEIKSEKLK